MKRDHAKRAHQAVAAVVVADAAMAVAVAVTAAVAVAAVTVVVVAEAVDATAAAVNAEATKTNYFHKKAFASANAFFVLVGSQFSTAAASPLFELSLAQQHFH
jgi:1,2-phenylacetyl-CoA epoxidase PaaB subunit